MFENVLTTRSAAFAKKSKIVLATVDGIVFLKDGTIAVSICICIVVLGASSKWTSTVCT